MQDGFDAVDWQERCKALGKLKKRTAESCDAETMRAVKQRLSDTEWRVRKAAIECISKVGDADECVIDLQTRLDDENPTVQKAAEAALAIWKKAKTAPGSDKVARSMGKNGALGERCISCSVTKPKAAFFIKAWRRPVGTRECACCTRKRNGWPVQEAHKETEFFQDLSLEAGPGGGGGGKVRPNNWGYLTYVDKVFGLDCFKELVRLGIFESAKDISESMGALQACARHGFPNMDSDSKEAKEGGKSTKTTTQEQWRRPKVLAVNIGDGQRPHTAGLMAFLTKWHTVSLDPELRPEWCGNDPHGIKRLFGVRDTFEGWMAKLHAGETPLPFAEESFDTLLLVGVHAHNQFRGPASMPQVIERFGHLDAVLVSLPCCQAFNPVNDLGREPDVTFEDLAIFSAKRRVNIWRWKASRSALMSEAEIQGIVDERDESRRHLDYATSDRLREELRAAGIHVDEKEFTWSTDDGRSGTFGSKAPGS